MSRTEASIAQRQSNQPRKLEDLASSPSWGIFSILADDAPSIFQYSIFLHFNQFICYLAALVGGSDRGGPVGEAEKTGGRVSVADPKLKRDG